MTQWKCTWVNDTGVTLIQSVAAAGDSVAYPRAFWGTPTLDQVVLTTWTTHDAPLRARAVVPFQSCGTKTKDSVLKPNMHLLKPVTSDTCCCKNIMKRAEVQICPFSMFSCYMMMQIRLSLNTCTPLHDAQTNCWGVKSVLAGDYVANDASKLKLDCILFVNRFKYVPKPHWRWHLFSQTPFWILDMLVNMCIVLCSCSLKHNKHTTEQWKVDSGWSKQLSSSQV